MGKKLLGLLIMVCISLSGCTTEYTKKDIAALVKKECNVRQFTVSDVPVEIKGEDGYTDRLWTVRLNGGSGLVFHVLDDFYWGMESTANYLCTDYNEVLLKQLADGYGFKNIKVKSGRENVLVFTTLTGTFSNREELDAALERYLVTCLDYRFEDHISEFTDEEIASIAAQSGFRIGISRDGGNTYDFCDYSYEGRNTDKTQNGYYYLKDGVKTSMQSYFHTHFTTYEIEEMTGLLLEQEMMMK